MKIIYWLCIAGFAFFLSSCSLFSPVPVEANNKYVLNKMPQPQIKKPRRKITLFITQPGTNSYYNTNQIAYSTAPYQIGYFAKNVWISNPAEMLKPLIVQSLQNTHYFHAVISSPVGEQYDYILNTQVITLLQDYTHGNCILRLSVKAEIIRMSNNRIIASKQFVISEPIMQKSPYGGVFAANQATSEMLRELTQFCLKNM